MKIGDTIQLKEALQGRRFKGKISKIYNNKIRVNLPSGMYAEYETDKWELIKEEE